MHMHICVSVHPLASARKALNFEVRNLVSINCTIGWTPKSTFGWSISAEMSYRLLLRSVNIFAVIGRVIFFIAQMKKKTVKELNELSVLFPYEIVVPHVPVLMFFWYVTQLVDSISETRKWYRCKLIWPIPHLLSLRKREEPSRYFFI